MVVTEEGEGKGETKGKEEGPAVPGIGLGPGELDPNSPNFFKVIDFLNDKGEGETKGEGQGEEQSSQSDTTQSDPDEEKEEKEKEQKGRQKKGKGKGKGRPKDIFDDDGEEEEEEEEDIIKTATEAIMNVHRFATIEESKEIWYYKDGVYIPGGDIQIEKTADQMYGYDLRSAHINEIKLYIMKKTYRKREEFDTNINIINLKNGLYKINVDHPDEPHFVPHTPDYLSLSQKPITYDPNAKAVLFGKFLKDVLYPSEIRTVIELMAYTFYRDNPFEIITKLFGYGANGKSVFVGLLTAIHGHRNISNVPLPQMLGNTFALSDLENKYVNIDTELPKATLHDTTILKKMTGRQDIRIERKNQKAYDTKLYAKLFFSANKVPRTDDDSNAYYRREVIISFPNTFEGKRDDVNLIFKLTTEQELSGIFNIMMSTLQNVLRNTCIFMTEKSIEQRREKHDLAVDPIGMFVREAIRIDSLETDETFKDDCYAAYVRFCKIHKIAYSSKETLGKNLKRTYDDGRESSGKRRHYWKGMELTDQYRGVESEQQVL